MTDQDQGPFSNCFQLNSLFSFYHLQKVGVLDSVQDQKLENRDDEEEVQAPSIQAFNTRREISVYCCWTQCYLLENEQQMVDAIV